MLYLENSSQQSSCDPFALDVLLVQNTYVQLIAYLLPSQNTAQLIFSPIRKGGLIPVMEFLVRFEFSDKRERRHTSWGYCAFLPSR